MFTIEANYIWYNKLDELSEIYNNSSHRGIEGKSPNDVFNSNIIIKANSIDDRKKTKAKFKIGDRIRISYQRNVFDKGYDKNWSWEIYKIKDVLITKPTTYTIEDEKGEIIKGSFYSEELQLTKQKEGVYLISEILKTKNVKGVKMALVKWVGYNDTTWEPYANLKDLKDIGKL